MTAKLAQAERVAALYGVSRMTVYRWANSGQFDVAPSVVSTPSGKHNRLLFDVDAVAEQYRDEMLRGLEPGPLRAQREARLKTFLGGNP